MRRGAMVTAVLAAAVLAGARPAMAIEQPKYQVSARHGEVELRDYPAYLLAETEIEGDFGSAGDEGFQRLFRYIGGDNSVVEVTAAADPGKPGKGAKIAMTAPVEQKREGQRWQVAFVVPSRYTLDTVPRPADARIKIREVLARRVAVRKFSGRWLPGHFETKRDELLAALPLLGLEPVGEPVYARYNPPFWPAFLRRNEVQIEVRAVASPSGSAEGAGAATAAGESER